MAQTTGGVIDEIKRPPKLVRVPITDGNWTAVGSGGIVTFIEGHGFAFDVLTGGLLQLALRTTFRGRFAEIRYKNQVAQNVIPPILHVILDGEVIPWPKPQVRYSIVAQGSGTPKFETGANWFIPVYDLTDREHTLDIVATSDPTITARMDFYGLNLEEHAAYVPEPANYRRTTQQVITTSAVAIPVQIGQSPSHLRTFASVGRLELTNPSGAGITARTIQIVAPANNWQTTGTYTSTAGSTWRVIVNPDDRIVIDLGDPTSALGVTVQDVTGSGSATATVVTVGRVVA